MGKNWQENMSVFLAGISFGQENEISLNEDIVRHL